MSHEHHEAFMLCGPTATGKTALAHLLAAELNAVILSADAMLVYRGMDIGTAKPTVVERERFSYGGLDLVEPDATFDVATWLDHAKNFLESARAAGRPVLVVGGTGLYIKWLLSGLTAQPSADPVWRAAADKMNLAELQRALQQIDAVRFEALTESDRQNPRRLIRAVELARELPSLGKNDTPVVQALEKTAAPVCLSLPTPLLWQRIEVRVATMFNQGLLDEARQLRKKFPQFSASAQQAIGYAEAFAVLDGALTEKAAREKIAIRTRQFAKRQMTWFKHQAGVVWVAA
ncbi:MAG: tRNA (adenosine(37)-N6)-dimethylallyltransferase MiaA, partial [Kiritimatiellaeota bacterium]|nr:tRNA (adenosine(37)-N6)-dimethylallyltransferase MiaA [Kiritimatiellota bacterium]